MVFDRDLEKIRAQLKPVVDEEPDRYERPHWAEQGQVPKLYDHFRDVVLDIL